MQLSSTDRFHCLLIVQCTCTTFYSISCHLQRNCLLDAYTCLDSRSNIDDKWQKTKIAGSKKKATKIPRTDWVMEGIIFHKRMIGILISWKKKIVSNDGLELPTSSEDKMATNLSQDAWLKEFFKFNIAELSITKTQQIKAGLIDYLNHTFEHFKQYFTHFYTLFHLHEYKKHPNNITQTPLPNTP